MVQIAASAPATALDLDPLFQPGMGAVVHMPVSVPAATRRLGESPTGYLAGYAEWQHRIGSYVRGMAAVGLSIAGTVGLLLALMLSRIRFLSEPLLVFFVDVKRVQKAVHDRRKDNAQHRDKDQPAEESVN